MTNYQKSLKSRLNKTYWRGLLVLVLLLSLAWQGIFSVATPAQAAFSGKLTGTINGADYLIEVPANWNGKLLLFSHGTVSPGAPNPAQNSYDEATGTELLKRGYALAGSSFSATGWALEQAFKDQIALLNYFEKTVGHPQQVIAWGISMGGAISAGLVEKYPQRFAGALPLCGVMAGGVAEFNLLLDGSFAFKTLLAPQSALQLTHISDPGANLGLGAQIFGGALQTPEGRARLALVASLADTSDWLSPGSPQPDPKDLITRFENEMGYLQTFILPFSLGDLRADLEHKAGGNPSWNLGVNYKKQLEKASNRDLVEALYQQAGLSLEKDLNTLNQAQRITPDVKAVAYLNKNYTFTGEIKVPVLTVHDTGDGAASARHEQNYRKVVHSAGNAKLLKQVYLDRAGHCTFTPAEVLTALQTLTNRIDSGKWNDSNVEAATLNSEALKLGPTLNGVVLDNGEFLPVPPAFTSFEPSPFLRPFFLDKWD
jgi:pimeloyl-ACP methyl ester carboxylesterase